MSPYAEHGTARRSPISWDRSDNTCMHRDQPVGERNDLVEVRGIEDDRYSSAPGSTDFLMNEAGGANIETARRILEHKEIRCWPEFAADNQLLLISARERRHPCLGAPRANVKPTDDISRVPRHVTPSK